MGQVSTGAISNYSNTTAGSAVEVVASGTVGAGGVTNTYSGNGFNPLYWFTNGSPGAWYDPSDFLPNWRRNLLTYTEQFDNAAWAKGVSATVTANATTAPDGTLSADSLTNSVSGANNWVSQTNSLSTTTTYTATVFAKKLNTDYLVITVYDGTNGNRCWFNLATGVIGSTALVGSGLTSISYSIIQATSGWYRCNMVFTTKSVTNITVYYGFYDLDGVLSQSANKTNYIWGAQLEQASTASAYQQIVTPEISYLTYQPQPVLYQDSAGTIPVTAVEQPVGLMLDKSKGTLFGTEIVVNGTFNTDLSGWSVQAGGTITWTSGGMQISGSGFNAYQAITLEIGKKYFFQYTPVSNGTQCIVSIGSGIGATDMYSFGSITTTTGVSFVATATTAYISIKTLGSAAVYDNISVRYSPGNHAFQATAGNRPTLSARVNLLTYSEQFDNAAWTKVNTTITANATTAPDGTLTADKLIGTATTAIHDVLQSITKPSGSYTATLSVYAKAAEHTYVLLQNYDGSGGSYITFNIQTGTVSTSATTYGTGWTVNSNSITDKGNGWYLCTFTATTTNALTSQNGIIREGNVPNLGPGSTGDGTSGVYIWGADLRPTNIGNNLPAYQRVNTATDYATTGFPLYLKTNGTSSAMATNSIDFTSTANMTVVTGVRKLSDAAAGILAELSAISTNIGSFGLQAPNSSTNSYRAESRGSSQSTVDTTGFSAPISNVVTDIMSISASVLTLRLNGTQVATSSATQGTGTYGNYPLYLFARAGTSLLFNGQFYGAIICGATEDANQITQAESYMNTKIGKVY